MCASLGPEAYASFENAMSSTAPTSIRLHAVKSTQVEGYLPETEAVVPWNPAGRYLSTRPAFTLDPTFHAGAYYVQEAGSMFVSEALRQTLPSYPIRRVLDLCAAPGGKTTDMLDFFSTQTLVVANEVIRTRVNPLRENLEKWGYPNIAVTNADAEIFGEMDGWFDVILVDAPCSGEGLFRKDPAAMSEWSPQQVDFCAARQRKILSAAVSALSPGGLLLYSTCTYNSSENEENVKWLCEKLELQFVPMSIPATWNITDTGLGYKFMPHRTRSEGFFIAALHKPGQPTESASYSSPGFKSLSPLPKNQLAGMNAWMNAEAEAFYFNTPTGEIRALPKNLTGSLAYLDKFVKSKWFGLAVGELKGKDLIPSQALANSLWLASDIPSIALNRRQALQFLKKENFDLPENAPSKGWVLATFGGLGLGWLKIVPGRFNNYFPAERRIRMEIDF